MGQRANLILVENGAYRLFYSHWCANTLPRDLFWGAEHAQAFIRIQREVDDSGWLDDVWAEGGALLDFDWKQLLLYGGEDILRDVPLRRVYMGLLAQVWQGWTIRWAYDGIADLADYVGWPFDRVLTRPDEESTDGTLTPPGEKDWTDLVASVRFEDGAVRLYPLAGDVASHLSAGPKLADNARPVDGLNHLFLDEWATSCPGGGFHLDLATKQLDFWVASDAPGIGNRVARAWPGWETRWYDDQFEMQLERTEGRLRFPISDRRTLIELCRQILLSEPMTSPVEAVKRIADQDREQGKNFQVNPWALHDDRFEWSTAERTAIFEKAMLSQSE
jgi:hypothetical protein